MGTLRQTWTQATITEPVQVAFTNAVVPTSSIAFTYDPALARTASMTDGIGTTTYTYTAFGTLGVLQVASIAVARPAGARM